MSAVQNLVHRNPAQIADVANVFRHAQVGVQAKRLRQISGLRIASRERDAQRLPSCHLWLPSRRQNLERRSLARAVGADQAEDLSRPTSRLMPPHGSIGP